MVNEGVILNHESCHELYILNRSIVVMIMFVTFVTNKKVLKSDLWYRLQYFLSNFTGFIGSEPAV